MQRNNIKIKYYYYVNGSTKWANLTRVTKAKVEKSQITRMRNKRTNLTEIKRTVRNTMNSFMPS